MLPVPRDGLQFFSGREEETKAGLMDGKLIAAQHSSEDGDTQEDSS